MEQKEYCHHKDMYTLADSEMNMYNRFAKLNWTIILDLRMYVCRKNLNKKEEVQRNTLASVERPKHSMRCIKQ